MTTIFVTIDFFLKDWYLNATANPNGELWLCVQPHVRKGDLAQFLLDLGQTRKFSFVLVQHNAAPADLVPVPLPSDGDLTIRFLTTNATLRTLTNHRTTGIARQAGDAAAQRLRSLNVAASEASPSTADTGAGPFVPSYNQGLQSVWQQFQDEQAANPDRIALDRITQMLGVAFWGGTPRVIPPSVFTGLNTVFLMTLPFPGQPPGQPAPADTLTTNLHSLTGLMVRAGIRQEAGTLSAVTNLEIAFDDGQPTPPVLATKSTPLGESTVTAFFKSLPNDITQHFPVAVWNPAFARRVYVTHPLQPFIPQPAMPGCFRRRSEGAGLEAQPDPSGMRYLIARYNKTPAAPPPTLLWNLFEAFEVNIQPYRDTRVRPDGNVLLQITPSAACRNRFYAELDSQLKVAPDWLKKTPASGGPIFIGSDGTTLTMTFVAVGQFPWSGEPRTILFYGPAPGTAGPTTGSLSATMLVKRPEQIKTDWKGQDDPWGKRYESQVSANGVSRSFSILQLDPSSPAGAAQDLVAGIAFAQQIRFEPAQSVSSIEGLLEVRYPNPRDLAAGDPVDVEEEYKHDLLNFNALNVYSSLLGGQPVALNPRTQLYPISRASGVVTIGTDQFLISYFHFRYADDVTPADSNIDSASFYEAVYSRMGLTRNLTFAIEHTYGTEIGSDQMSLPANGAPVASPADFPPALPNEVALTAAAAPSYTGSLSHFCAIEFNEPAESATLHFATRWLSPTWNTKDLYPIQSAAWRSVTELSHAARIELTGNFMRFRFQQALAATGSAALTNTFAAGLEPVPGLENFSQDITALVQNECRKWAAGLPAAEPAIPIPLALPAGLKLAGNCVVLNFALRITRDPGTLPPASGSVDFVEPQPVVTTDNQGQLMRPIPTAEVGSLYDQWRTAISQRSAPLEPYFTSDSARQVAQQVSKLLSSASVSGDAAGNWIAMSNAPVPQAAAVASACPFAFRPLRREATLGDNTFLVMTLYSWALDLVLRGAVQESNGKDAAAWTQYFGAIQAQLASIAAIVQQLRDLVEPLPNGDSKQLDAEAAAALAAFQNDASFRAVIQSWVTSELWASPALFGNAKALLYTRLRNGDAASGAIDSFARLLSRKQIHGTVGDEAWEQDGLLVWESLPGSASTNWFGFGEVLDALRYGDDFIFGDIHLGSLATLIAELAAPDSAAQDEIPATLHIPSAPQSGAQSIVRLASRQPVVKPICHFSMALNECQTRNNILKFSGKAISLDQLIQGDFPDPSVAFPAPAAGSRAAVLIPQQTTSFDRGSQQDRFVLSALFSVRGDETAWPGTANDSFFIGEYSKSHPPPDTPTAAPTTSSSWLGKLADNLHPDQIPSLETQVLDPNVIALVLQALQPANPESDFTLAELLKQANFQVSQTGGAIKTTVKAAAHPLEAYIFHTGTATPAEDVAFDLGSLLLLVNVQVPIWSPVGLGLVQTRNLLPSAGGFALGPDFGKDFAEISPTAAPHELHQPFKTSDLSNLPAVQLARKQYSVTEIVSQLLLNNTMLPANNTDWNASGTFLSVTVRAIQFIHSLESWVDGGDVQGDKLTRAVTNYSFVVCNYRFDPAGPPGAYTAPLDWFEKDTSIGDYYFDFQWSSGSNLQFFRISSLPVQAV